MRVEPIKLLEDNVCVNLHDLELGNGFSDMAPKTRATNAENR